MSLKKHAWPKYLSSGLLLMILLLLSLASATAFAGDSGGLLRIVLRYYDSIQINYTINYPGGSLWTGAADVPIGGVGAPDPASKLSISEYLSSQVYCADPFMPFHGKVVGLGGEQAYIYEFGGWSSKDALSGYVSGVPWELSGAMQRYGDAVRWIVVYGYRGDFYNHFFKGGDEEGEESVSRLNAMYPDMGDVKIDAEIALMATKVAIWKTLAGDDVAVNATTLGEGTPRRIVFDNLVQALTGDAKDQDSREARESMLAQKAAITTLRIEINDAEAVFDEAKEDFDYYGPIIVTGALENGNALPDLGKVFLTAGGLNTSGVCFMSAESGEPGAVLGEDTLYGTDRRAQYIRGSLEGGAAWKSDPFYLAVPKGRVEPPRGDQLMVRAMAMAPGVEVAEGTPIAFIYEFGGAQDWDAIQAFIGGAKEGAATDLYAEASLYTGDTTLGELWISKQVENATPVDNSQEFRFAVYYNAYEEGGAGGASSYKYAEGQRLNLTDHPVRGAASVNTGEGGDPSLWNTFTLKNGGLAKIEGLPMVVEGDPVAYTYCYRVEEIDCPSQYDLPRYFNYNFTSKGDIPLTEADYFTIDTDMEAAAVTVINKREAKSFLRVSKKAFSADGSEIFDGPFTFIITCSQDNQAPWYPVNLTGRISGSLPDTHLADGEFALNAYGMAYIELDPDLDRAGAPLYYRVTEAAGKPDSASPYAAFYMQGTWEMEGSGGKLYLNKDSRVIDGNLSAAWLLNKGKAFVTEGFAYNANLDHEIMFFNVAAPELKIGKTAGDGVPAGKAFDFEICMVENGAESKVPLTMDAELAVGGHMALLVEITDAAGAIAGAESRIVSDSEGRPVILRLMQNEAARIANLPQGQYRVHELTADYSATYKIGDGGSQPGRDAAITLDKDSQVIFYNYIANNPEEPDTPEEPETPEGPDTPGEPAKPEGPGPGEPTEPEAPKPDEPEKPTPPGGTYPPEPPTPTTPGNTLEPNGPHSYIEKGEDGVPQGEWIWDNDSGQWVFHGYNRLPKTGDFGIKPGLSPPLLVVVIVSGLALGTRIRKKQEIVRKGLYHERGK